VRAGDQSLPMRYFLLFLLTAVSAFATDRVYLTLEQSTGSLGNWQEVPLTADQLAADGRIDGGVFDTNNKFFRLKIQAPDPFLREAAVMVQGGTLPVDSGLAGQTVGVFAIAKNEVTWDEWQRVRTFAVARGYDLDGIGAGSSATDPVREVSWYDVVKWCNAKSEMDGTVPVYRVGDAIYKTGESEPSIAADANGYRLPTEAEWEWAARGGVNSHNRIYSGSDDLNAVGWYFGNSGGATVNIYDGHGSRPIAQKAVNELGIFDMSGNIFEWCFDTVPGFPTYRRTRGGSWFSAESSCRVADRSLFDYAGSRYTFIGFRLARRSGM